MGFFDRIIGKQPKPESLNNNVPNQTVPVSQNVGVTEKQELEARYDYKNLFVYALGLDKTLQKMGIDNIDLEALFAKENIEEKIGEDNQYAKCKQNDLTIVFDIHKDVITVKIDKSSNGLEGQRVVLTFDKETHVETKRLIQDYITENNEKTSVNTISIGRTPGRIEQVEYTHFVRRTWQDKQDINASIDKVYTQIPGGSEIVKTPEEIAEFEAMTGFDWSVDDRYYPSYLKNIVLIKQIDLSNVPGDISSLESLHGLDDSKISDLAVIRDSNAEEKCSRVGSKILSSPRCREYLRNMLYPKLQGNLWEGNLFNDSELVDNYRNKIKINFERDREQSDKQNQSTDLYNANGDTITIYDKEGTPITRNYIAQLIKSKQEYDKWHQEEMKRLSERNDGDEYEYDFG